MSGKQDALSILNDRSAFDGIPSQAVSLLAPHVQRSPIPAYDEQSDQKFARGLSLYGAQYGATDRTVETPLNQLYLFTLENARFVLHPGLDGMILDQQHRVIIEPSCFCQHGMYQSSQRLPDMQEHEELDEVFLGFDAAWRNYYHWILYGVSKMQIAETLLSPQTRFIVPDMPKAGAARRPTFVPETFETSLRLAKIQNRIFRASDGVHRARKLHFLWHSPTMPELYLNFPEPHQHFDTMTVPARHDLPSRFYVTREGGHDSRISPEEQSQIDPVLERRGFQKIYLETLDLETQIALFRQAKCILAPHGAGLANLAFSPPGTRVLELNRLLDGQSHLRNCFYVIAARRGLTYMVLDLDEQALTSELLDHAVTRLEGVSTDSSAE